MNTCRSNCWRNTKANQNGGGYYTERHAKRSIYQLRGKADKHENNQRFGHLELSKK